MDTELMLDVGQANEIKLAARRAGATNADLKRLSEGETFAQILPVIRGLGEVTITKHIIDCDADPIVPDGWEVVEHQEGGQFEWDSAKVALYLSDKQKSGVIEGNELRKELKSQRVLNANVLDYLLAHPHLIPEEWRGKLVFFWGTIYWGTIYRSAHGSLYVRCLLWRGDGWRWNGRWLDDDFSGGGPAAVLASS